MFSPKILTFDLAKTLWTPGIALVKYHYVLISFYSLFRVFIGVTRSVILFLYCQIQVYNRIYNMIFLYSYYTTHYIVMFHFEQSPQNTIQQMKFTASHTPPDHFGSFNDNGLLLVL